MSGRDDAGIRADAVVLVDLINDFKHEDGEALLAGFRERHDGMLALLRASRERGLPVVYANDTWGIWDGDRQRLVREAIEHGLGGDLISRIAPLPDERLILKPRYSAFDHTPLELVLGELGARRLLIAGAATEHCVAHTALASHQLGFETAVAPGACACVSPEQERITLDFLEHVAGIELRSLGESRR